jgi:hypothetical protein
MPDVLDLTGRTFGRLTVIERGPNVPRGPSRWICKCSCGTARTRPIQSQRLRSGDTTSCGCVRVENGRKKEAAPAMRAQAARVGQYIWPHTCKGCGSKFKGTARLIYCQPSWRPRYPRFRAHA